MASPASRRSILRRYRQPFCADGVKGQKGIDPSVGIIADGFKELVTTVLVEVRYEVREYRRLRLTEKASGWGQAKARPQATSRLALP